MKTPPSILIFILFAFLACYQAGNAQNTEQIISKADSLINAKNYTEAIVLLEKNLNLFENDAVYDVALVYNRLSFCYLFTKQFKLSEQLARKAFEANSSLTWVKINWAHALLFQGKTSAAEKIYDELLIYYVLTLLENFEQLEKGDIVPQDCRNDFERIKTNTNKAYEAIKIYKQVKNLYSADKQEDAINLFYTCISSLPKQLAQWFANEIDGKGAEYFYSGDYSQAKKYFMEAKNIREKTLGKEHPDYLSSLNNLSSVYGNSGEYDQAIKYLLEAKSVGEQVLGKEHPDYGGLLSNLGALYVYTGDYEQAKKYLLEAKSIQEEAGMTEHTDYVVTLGNLGALYVYTGDYEQAGEYLLKAKQLYEKIGKHEHPDYVATLGNLGQLYVDLNDKEQAEKYLLEAKNITEKIWGKEHPNYITVLNDLGILYHHWGKNDQAEKYLLEAKNKLNSEHPYYVTSLNNLGSLYHTWGKNDQAADYLLEAKNIQEETNRTEHDNYAATLNCLGLIYGAFDIYPQAEYYLLEAKSITEKIWGKEHPHYAASLSNIGLLYQDMGKYEDARILNNEKCELITKHVNKNFAFLSEQQRNKYWEGQEYYFIASYSLSWFSPVPLVNSLNYNNTLFAKGLLLRTTNNIRDAIYLSGNDELIKQYEQLNKLRQQIGNLQRQSDYKKDYVQSLEARADSLDKVLTQASQTYRDFKADVAITWDSVQKKLQPNEAAVEFVDFRLYNKQWTDSTIYAALVLRPNMEPPAWIPLCEQKELDAILQLQEITKAEMDYIEETSRTDEEKNDKIAKLRIRKIETVYLEKSKDLYQLIWKKLENELNGVETVYYSPSGLLHKITFNALPAGNENELLSEKYNLQLVSSTREIVRVNNTTAVMPSDTAVVYGGLNYNALPLSQTATFPEREKGKSPQVWDGLSPKPRGRDFDLRGFLPWKYLPGTKTEAEDIIPILDDRQIPRKYRTNSDGTEASAKNLSGTNTGILHFATHGFFRTDNEKQDIEFHLLGDKREKPFKNPLLRSGLVMSGANLSLDKEIFEDDEEDNLLTADEISKLNLTKAQLVVLSACETGLGDVKNSEGVFGLQRAFKLAGVETLIMSLWVVDDTVTAEFMKIFYRLWLSENLSKQNAFKTAQQQIRKKHQSPYYWAAFVMMD